MPDLTFVTGNSEKFKIASHVFSKHGIRLVQGTYDIDEIQHHEGEPIVRDKARKAFELTGGPVVVNDDSWVIHGLRGFPGPYMKDVSEWFTADDFIRLTRDLPDRRVSLIQLIAYQDDTEQRVFRMEFQGELLPEARGKYGISWHKVVTMPGDDGLSIAEAYDAGHNLDGREVTQGWEAFITWYEAYVSPHEK